MPFVLTPDMAYVINGGDRQSRKFHQFVDVCCHAFNLLRKHRSLFVNLFALVRYSVRAVVFCDQYYLCFVFFLYSSAF